MDLITSVRWIGFFWGAMDAFYIFFVIFSSLKRGVAPFFSDFTAALANMDQWGGGLEFIVWMGLVTQLSLVASSVLLCLGSACAVYVAGIQTPFRILFIVPSFSLILLLPDTSTAVWLSLIVASEVAKVWSLWWLWKNRD
ncbi:hypothetical protein [Pseudomonas sp. NPDC089406]|uniref:hypothetical protein n=1 Tax=Pseudomonas sp. NPDC089406 TaxID=3364463 RepID=UPI00384B15DB